MKTYANAKENSDLCIDILLAEITLTTNTTNQFRNKHLYIKSVKKLNTYQQREIDQSHFNDFFLIRINSN